MDKAGDLLKSFFSFYNLGGGEKYVALFSSWRKMAGEDVASHSRILDLRKGALVVEVDHPGWMQVLQMKREGILKNLAAAYPGLGIRMLHLRLAKDGQFSLPPEPEPEQKAALPPSEEPAPTPEFSESETFQEKTPLDDIHDEELKMNLLRLKKTLKQKKK
jgi:hypothetical protein